MEIVTVDSQGRIVIPKEVRNRAGIRENSKLAIADTGEGSILMKRLDLEEILGEIEEEMENVDVDKIVGEVKKELRKDVRNKYGEVLSG